MTAKPTPGPWSIEPESFDLVGGYQEPYIRGPVDERGMSHQIAIIRIGLIETEANASLIAAAPDLLSSLKTIIAGFEEGVFLCSFNHGEKKKDWAKKLFPFLKALAEAQAAIADAEDKWNEGK